MCVARGREDEGSASDGAGDGVVVVFSLLPAEDKTPVSILDFTWSNRVRVKWLERCGEVDPEPEEDKEGDIEFVGIVEVTLFFLRLCGSVSSSSSFSLKSPSRSRSLSLSRSRSLVAALFAPLVCMGVAVKGPVLLSALTESLFEEERDNDEVDDEDNKLEPEDDVTPNALRLSSFLAIASAISSSSFCNISSSCSFS